MQGHGTQLELIKEAEEYNSMHSHQLSHNYKPDTHVTIILYGEGISDEGASNFVYLYIGYLGD